MPQIRKIAACRDRPGRWAGMGILWEQVQLALKIRHFTQKIPGKGIFALKFRYQQGK